MHNDNAKTLVRRQRRKSRISKPLRSSGKARLTVFRSSKNIYAQIIDDRAQATVVGVGSLESGFRDIKNPKEVAKQVGLKLAALAKSKGVTTVVFDRGAYKFHGRIAALAEGAREGGLAF